MAKAKGGEWKSNIYFDPEADSQSGPDYRISDGELISKMSDLVEGHEEILNVRAYKCKLWIEQVTQLIFYHAFVVYETKEWWWSVEKNTEGITIQRSKKASYVRDRYRMGDRPTPIKLMKEDKGRRTMKDLIDYLYVKDELNKAYNLISDNCQHFAKRIFDEIAESEYLMI